jgi:dipeptidyl aminopeptidase/acylaminoacyl peptidase
MLVSHQSSQRPSDIWVYDLASGKPQQLTFSAIASLSPSTLPPSQIVHFNSFDRQVISALLWLPFNAKRDGTIPGIVVPHGGPTGQTVDVMNRTIPALVSRGYAVIAPNPRGSVGYGKAFQKENYQDLGGGDLKDYLAGRQWLIDTGFVDSNKIGITGGSYGGFMTLMAIGKNPDMWNAAVDVFGVLNWMSMLKNSDPLLQSYVRSLLGDPEKDRAIYEDTSPLKYLKNATAPLLVLQGENDIRVPKNESEQAVSMLQQAGKTVEVKYYPEEGHGFVKRENQIDAIRRTVEWFDKYLKGQTPRTP